MTDAWLTDALGLLPALLAGTVLGAAFYGGLWLTVRHGMLSARPALWFFGSLGTRTGIALLGFWLVGSGHWERLVACLLGFVTARLFVTRLTRSTSVRFATDGTLKRDAHHT